MAVDPMGYFRPKIRRSRSRKEISQAIARQSIAVPGWLLLADGARSPKRGGFVRLAVERINSSSHHLEGVFRAGYRLRDSRTLPVDRQQRLEGLLAWFERDLPVPRKLSRSAICWFKSNAAECMRHIWELVHALQAAGELVSIITTRRPGKIVYEDALQVAAVPFRDSIRPQTAPRARAR